MRLGLIARADSRGLGIQTKAVHDNLHPVKTMVVDCPSANPLPLRPGWFPGATWVKGLPTHTDFHHWLQGLDAVYTAETGYGQALWDVAQSMGVKTVLHVNYEFLDLNDRPTVWAAPSLWHYEDIPFPNKTFLPVPITPAPSRRRFGARFLHVVGRPAVHDRNGTLDLLNALQYVQSEITVTVTCQDPNYINLTDHHVPANVTVQTVSGDVADHHDLYQGQDVLVMPRRFGGLCLPVNEALGFGMPVIMPNVSPNNTWLPQEWLTPATHKGVFRAKQHVDIYQTNPQALAAKIDQLADPGFYAKAVVKAGELAQTLSWDALTPLYEQTLRSQ